MHTLHLEYTLGRVDSKKAQRAGLFFTFFFLLFFATHPLLQAQTLALESEATAEDTSEQTPDAESESSEPTPSLFKKRMTFEKVADYNPFVLLPHKPTYFLPITYNTSPNTGPFETLTGNEMQRAEIKLQFSLKFLTIPNLFKDKGQLSVAYTQQSYWQAYQFGNSSPFRETNHEVELMLSFFNDTEIVGFINQVNTFGLSHHSNGRAGEFSQSWNRFYVNFYFEKRNLLVNIKPWIRIPDGADNDENPDIEKYYGYGELMAYYRMGEYTLGFTLRNNLRAENKGAIQVDWTFPFYNKLNGYFQYFNGYGESLIDYKDSTNRFGLGLMLTNWL